MACQGISRVFLIIINIFFVIIGTIILGAGIAVKIGSKYLDDYIKSMEDSIGTLVNGANLVPGTNPTTDPSLAADLNSIFGIVGILFIILGLFLFCLGFSGCCGACCKVKPLLIFYCLFALIIFVLFIAVLVLFANKKVDSSINTQLENIVKTSYTGVDDIQPTSLFLNYIMIKYKCCGIKDYTDFQKATKWKSTRQMNILGVTRVVTMVTPVACCKMSGDFPSVTPIDSNCTIGAIDANNNMNSGCNKEITKFLDPYRSEISGVCGGIAALQFVCMALAIYLLFSLNSDNKVGQ